MKKRAEADAFNSVLAFSETSENNVTMKLKLLVLSRTLAWLLSIVVLSAAVVPSSAQTKIGTVDLKKVFDGYFRTKQADAQLKERAADAEKVLKSMMDDYQTANDEYKKLVESASDQAISNEERARRKQAAETKLLDIKDIEQSIAQFRRSTQATLDEQKRRMRESILREITEIVSTKAKARNLTLVVDTAAESINQTLVVLYSDGQNDLTQEVLDEVNSKAPVEFRRSPAPAN